MLDKDIKTLSKIILHIKKIIEYIGPIESLETFNQNQLIVDAVVFNLSQIGEISKFKVSSELKMRSDQIPWQALYGFRNRIVHDYDQINMTIVYEVVKEDLPVLLKQLKSLKEELINHP
jgi:uncharacterized protein with HEPN domain